MIKSANPTAIVILVQKRENKDILKTGTFKEGELGTRDVGHDL